MSKKITDATARVGLINQHLSSQAPLAQQQARSSSKVAEATRRLSTPVQQDFSSQAPIPAQQRRMASTSTSSGSRGTIFKLNTGASIPALGFGTWQDKDAQEPAVLAALASGYRHIDTARIYGTESAVGRAIARSGVPRSDIFLVTKLWNNAHHPEDVEAALDASLADLGTDYVDLYLMHWPSPFKRGEKLMPKRSDGGGFEKGDTDYVQTWKAMERVYRKGKARAIGISNFSKAEVERLLAETEVVPAAHQIELHPFLQQQAFTSWHATKSIHVTQYSPFGNANTIYDSGAQVEKLIENAELRAIGESYSPPKSAAQVALAWGIAHGRSVIPKSKTESRIRDNLAGDFELREEDVKRVDKLDRKLRFNDPSKSFGWEFYGDLEGKKDENRL